MVADVARHVVHRHAPDLLLLHLLCTDSLQHLHGPRSPEAYWAIEYVDALVGRVLDALPEEAVVAVVSDHGFLPVDREARPNVRLRRMGAPARFVMNHGACLVYDDDPVNADRVASQLAADLAAAQGVARVWRAPEYGALGLPSPGEHPWAADLMLEAAPGYVFVNDGEGDEVSDAPRYRGTHGHRPDHADNAALFLAAGPGVAPAGP
jgi:predicted AlkP superfamily pyrophosphatase or phosphodiesterase